MPHACRASTGGIGCVLPRTPPCPHHDVPPRPPRWPARQAPGRRGHHCAADVRVLLPGNDRVQHSQTDYAVEIHRRARRRQPALRAARRGVAHRRLDAAVQRGDRAAAASLRDSRDAGGPGGAARGVLGPLSRGRRLGVGRVLCAGPGARPPAHQPVLDAGQRHLRSAAGQAAVRVHRGRGEPGRRDRRRADGARRR